jgi:hypothetical protein
MTIDRSNDERDPEDALDRVLRDELRWQTPPDLSARLMALVPQTALVVSLYSVPIERPRANPWYSTLVLLLTTLALGISMAIAWQIASSLGAEFGLVGIWEQIRAWPELALQWLFSTVPASRALVAMLESVRDQLHWLLLALVFWLALDGWQPQRRRPQQTS